MNTHRNRVPPVHKQLCTFRVDGMLFGIDVRDVQEVICHQRMTQVPLAPRLIGGLINLRGQIVTALHLRERLGLPAGGRRRRAHECRRPAPRRRRQPDRR